MIKEISLDIAESIKESLLIGNLTNEVHLKIGDYEINIDNLENSIIDENNELMEKTIFSFRGFFKVLTNGKQRGELFFSIGQWRDEKSYRFVDTHIVLGAKMIHNFFSQIDLSDAVEDKENIYLLKNLSSKAGRGSIVRLYTGKGSFSAEERVAKLLENYRDQTIERNSKKWVKVCTINKKLLEKTDENRSILLTKFVEDFLKFSFLVEEIRRL